MGGTYVLVVDLPRATTIEVGALGDREFEAGTYAYVGSAFGPGGFARIDRHRELAQGERDTRHWHIDYLLGHPETRLTSVITFSEADRECELAVTLPGDPVDSFGASDCNCSAHLLDTPGTDAVLETVTAEGGRLREE